jgi:hypothetical protein
MSGQVHFCKAIWVYILQKYKSIRVRILHFYKAKSITGLEKLLEGSFSNHADTAQGKDCDLEKTQLIQ